jgi:hypothetical protein
MEYVLSSEIAKHYYKEKIFQNYIKYCSKIKHNKMTREISWQMANIAVLCFIFKGLIKTYNFHFQIKISCFNTQ